MKVVWLCLAITVLAVEAVGLAAGGPLTLYVRDLQASLWGKAILVPLWIWLTWHWFVEPMHLRGTLADDLILLAGSVLLVLLVGKQRKNEQAKIGSGEAGE